MMNTELTQQRQSTYAADELSPEHMLPGIRSKVDRSYAPVDYVRRMQANAKRAANAANEITQMLRHSSGLPYNEMAFLLQAAAFFDRLSKSMEGERKRAKIIERREKQASEAKLDQEIKSSIATLFGQSPKAEAVRSMADDMITFIESVDEYLKVKYNVAFGMLPIVCSTSKLESAVADGNLIKITSCIALLHTEMKDRGGQWIGEEGEPFYVAGWADFIEYRDGLRVIATASAE